MKEINKIQLPKANLQVIEPQIIFPQDPHLSFKQKMTLEITVLVQTFVLIEITQATVNVDSAHTDLTFSAHSSN